MDRPAGGNYAFGPFVLNSTERTLTRDDELVSLTQKAFDTLYLLVQNAGHVLEKDDMMSKIWPDTFVEEATLAQNIFTLRKVMGETPELKYIETVVRRGYRFVARVTEQAAQRPESASVPAAASHLQSIAVLPFENLSGDREQRYFSDGITQDIIIELSRNHGLFVIARDSSFQYRDRAIDVKRIGH